jgi:hypothetical protein
MKEETKTLMPFIDEGLLRLFANKALKSDQVRGAAEDYVLHVLQKVGASAPTFPILIRSWEAAGFTLEVTPDWCKLHFGRHDFSYIGERKLCDIFKRFFWATVDCSQKGLSHDYLILRLHWVTKSNGREDLSPAALGYLQGAIRVRGTAYLLAMIDAAFAACPDWNRVDERAFTFMSMVVGTAKEQALWS